MSLSWEFDLPREGRTLGSSHALPSPSCFLLFHADALEEFRVVLAPPEYADRETRGGGMDVFTVALRQHGGSRLSMGFGNPSDRRAADYRSCTHRRSDTASYWFICDAPSGWVVLGSGANPAPPSVLLSLKLAPGDARLARMSRVSASNWNARVSVRVQPIELPAATALIQLVRSSHKFDLQGTCTSYAGVTTVCALPAEHPLHIAMSRVHDAVLAEPLLRGVYALLPPSSYHMTVLAGVSGSSFHEQVSRSWAGAPPGIAPVSTAAWDVVPRAERPFVGELAARLAREGVSTSRLWTTFAMRVQRISIMRVTLEPWDRGVADALAAWRDHVGRLLGTEVDPHYGFHATISYSLLPAGRDEAVRAAQERVDSLAWAAEVRAAFGAGPVVVCSPALCYFRDMGAFYPVDHMPM